MLNTTITPEMRLVQNQQKVIFEIEQKLSEERVRLEIVELFKNLKVLSEDKELVIDQNNMPKSDLYPTLDPRIQHIDLAKAELQRLIIDRVYCKRLLKDGFDLYKPCDEESMLEINSNVNSIMKIVTQSIAENQNKKTQDGSVPLCLGLVTLVCMSVFITANTNPRLSYSQVNNNMAMAIFIGMVGLFSTLVSSASNIIIPNNPELVINNAFSVAKKFFEEMDSKTINETTRGTLVFRKKTFAQKLESFFGYNKTELNPLFR